MKLPGHQEPPIVVRPTIASPDGAENQEKLRRNVLRHVLGFKYPRALWRTEGWHMIFTVRESLRDVASRALRPFTMRDPYRDPVEEVHVKKALREDGDVCAIADELVDDYRRAIEEAVRGWIVDFHWPAVGKYRLVDGRGIVVAGDERKDAVRPLTCYRCSKEDWPCATWSEAERVDQATWEAARWRELELDPPIRHERQGA